MGETSKQITEKKRKRSTRCCTCNKSLSRQKRQTEKKRERLVIPGMLINIHELLSLDSIFKMTGLLSTVSSQLESAIVKGHRRASLCCITVLSNNMIRYWFFVKDADWTDSCPANDPGYQVLQVSLAFIPSLVFVARETCNKSTRCLLSEDVVPFLLSDL